MSNGLACIPCGKFFRVKKGGVAIEEGMPLTGDVHGPWGPYKLWMADLCECPGCGAQVAAGFGHAPVAEHYQPGYRDMAERMKPIARVDDCGGKKP